jgi:hypothetical protein
MSEKYDPEIHGRPRDEEAARRRILGLPAPPRNPFRHTADRPARVPVDHEFPEGDRYRMGYEIRPGLYCDRPLEDVLAGIQDERGQPEDEEP